MTIVRDHRSKADIQIPRGQYAHAKAAALGLATPAPTSSVLQRVRSTRPAGSTIEDGSVVRDHRPGRLHASTLTRSRRSLEDLPELTRTSSLAVASSTQRSSVLGSPARPQDSAR